MTITTKCGDFVIRRNGPTWAPEMMLHTHGGYYSTDGMVEVNDGQICLYESHTQIITFDFAQEIMVNPRSDNEIKTIIPAGSGIWNYILQRLSDEERDESIRYWNVRSTSPRYTNWDWWEVDLKLPKISNMKKLKETLIAFGMSERHVYSRIHFLCCRKWMDKSPPPAFGALKAPIV